MFGHVGFGKVANYLRESRSIDELCAKSYSSC